MILQVIGPTDGLCEFCVGDKKVRSVKVGNGQPTDYCWRCIEKIVDARVNGKEKHAPSKNGGDSA